MKTIKQQYTIHAPVDKVWKALVDPKVINKWGGGPAKMNDKEGAIFSLWGGDIHGKNVKVTPGKNLIQEWFGGAWDEASVLTLTFSQKGESTTVDLLHEKVPDNEAKDIADGWEDYYMGPLKKFVENNS